MRDYARSSQEWLNRNVDRLEQLRLSAAAKRDAVDSVRGTAQSPRGDVRAEIGPTGDLTDLRLSDSALSMGPAELARTIQTTVNAARQSAADTLNRALGADAMASAKQLQDEIGEPSRQAPSNGRDESDDDTEDDWPAGGRFLHDPRR